LRLTAERSAFPMNMNRGGKLEETADAAMRDSVETALAGASCSRLSAYLIPAVSVSLDALFPFSELSPKKYQLSSRI
jgi:hypothetical protein